MGSIVRSRKTEIRSTAMTKKVKILMGLLVVMVSQLS